MIPVTHVFEGMRAALAGRTDLAPTLAIAFCLNLLWILVAGLTMARVLRVARERGLITKVVTQ
jgi:ABC-type polysaccharide/polyol phosphate export permease